MRRYKRIVGVVAFLFIVLWTIGVIDVNSRFPQPEVQEYGQDDWLEYDDSILLNVNEIKYELAEVSVDENKVLTSQKNTAHILVKFRVKNKTESDIDFYNYFMRFDLVVYPIGYNNQGSLRNMNEIYIKAGEEKEFIAEYNLTEGLIKQKFMEKFLNNKFCLCIRTYPVRQMFVFEQVQRDD